MDVVGVAVLSELVSLRTLNPANWLFSMAYRLVAKGTESPFARFIFKIVCGWRGIISDPYHRYLDVFNEGLQRGVRFFVFDENSITSSIQSLKVDLLILNGWDVLPQHIIECPKQGSINIHPSKLPRHRGALPTLWSLKEGDISSAVTFLTVGKGIDDGLILRQTDFAIEATDTSTTMERKIGEIVVRELADVVLGYLDGRLVGSPQVGGSSGTGRWEAYKGIRPQKETAREIANKIWHYPELEPFAYAYILVGGKKVQLRSCQFYSGDHGDTPLGVSRNGFRLVITAAGGKIESRLFRDIGFWASLCVLGNVPQYC